MRGSNPTRYPLFTSDPCSPVLGGDSFMRHAQCNGALIKACLSCSFVVRGPKLVAHLYHAVFQMVSHNKHQQHLYHTFFQRGFREGSSLLLLSLNVVVWNRERAKLHTPTMSEK
jgi:hypothetical protein